MAVREQLLSAYCILVYLAVNSHLDLKPCKADVINPTYRCCERGQGT